MRSDSRIFDNVDRVLFHQEGLLEGFFFITCGAIHLDGEPLPGQWAQNPTNRVSFSYESVYGSLGDLQGVDEVWKEEPSGETFHCAFNLPSLHITSSDRDGPILVSIDWGHHFPLLKNGKSLWGFAIPLVEGYVLVVPEGRSNGMGVVVQILSSDRIAGWLEQHRLTQGSISLIDAARDIATHRLYGGMQRRDLLRWTGC